MSLPRELQPRSLVLVVDDEAAVRETAAAVLSEQFDVQTASSAFEALNLLRAHPFTVLCTDFSMPGMSGLDLIQSAAPLYPGLFSVLMTGYQELLPREDDQNPAPYITLLKPYAPQKLLGLVERAAQFGRMKTAIGMATGKS